MEEETKVLTMPLPRPETELAEAPRLLATDVDGTLLDAGGELNDEDRRAVEWLQARGIPVVLATGRTWEAARPIAQELGIRAPMVLYNGARVVSASGRVLHQRPLDARAVKLAEELARRAGLRGFAYLPAQVLPLAGGEACADYLLPEDRALIPARLPAAVADGLAGRAAIKLLFLGPPEACDAFEHACRSFSRLLRPVRSGRECVEVLAPGVSKASGLAFLLRRLRLRPSQVVAAGDGLNDVEMLRLVGHPVAVATAEPALLRQARHVVPAPPQAPLAHIARVLFARGAHAGQAGWTLPPGRYARPAPDPALRNPVSSTPA